MRKVFKSLIEKISLEFAILFVSIFLVTGGFVYATWNQSQTDLADQSDEIDGLKWNALVDQISSDCNAAGNSNCDSSTVANAKTSSSAGVFYLTQQNWYSFVDLANQALGVCACQAGDCGQWDQAKSPTGLSKGTWNVLINEVYKKCIGNSCWNNASLAKISNSKLTKENWNGYVNLLHTSMANCYASLASTTIPETPTTTPTTCIPNCTGKVCGDNGCGGSCGSCSSGSVCNSGQCINATVGYSAINSGSCADFCTGLSGVCNSVGTDVDGKNGLLKSVVLDSKSGLESCSDVAGSCLTSLSPHTSICDGHQADWVNCNCTICASNWKQACGQNTGDATCINTGAISCNGECQGASFKSKGTDCGTNAKCDGNGKCVPCINNYLGSCDGGLGDAICLYSGTYDCFGACIGASRKIAGTNCGYNTVCDIYGKCIACAPNCSGKQCGSDGCGQSCGTCESGKVCDASGQCAAAAGYIMSGGQTCDNLCAGLNGLCNSVGTDTDGKNGLIKSVTIDSKSSLESCADIAGQCSTVLGTHTSICDGRQADWSYCNCKLCDSNWKGECGQDLGDSGCVNLGKTNCDGQCDGFSYKAAGTLCGNSLECDGTGQCTAPLNTLIKVNTATGRSCSDICQNNWNNRSCVSVGTNESADNGLLKSADIDAKTGASTCKEIQGDCDTVLSSLAIGCDGAGAEWTYCKCSL